MNYRNFGSQPSAVNAHRRANRAAILISTSALFVPGVTFGQDLLVDGAGIFSGNLSAPAINITNATVSGTATVAGALQVAGSTNLTGVAVAGALNVNGVTTLNGANITNAVNVTAPLNVVGDSTLTGVLSVSGATTANSVYVNTNTNTDTLTVRRGVSVGQLSVSGGSQMSDTMIEGSLTATGPTNLTTARITNAAVDNSLTVGGSMDVAGRANFSGNVTIAGSSATDSSYVNGLTDTGTLNVRDAATVGELSVSGTSSLGNTSVSGNLEVAGSSMTDSSYVNGLTDTGTLNVRDAATVGQLSVAGTSSLADTSVSGNLEVSGHTQTNSLSAGEIEASNLRVSGTLTVEGMIDLPRRYSFGEITVEGQSTLGNTAVAGAFSATYGANSLLLGQDSFTVSSGADGSTIRITEEEAEIQHQGSGLRTSSGVTEVSGAERTTVSGGGTSVVLSSSGARLSGANGAPARLSGIADGIERHDAVNVGQMNAGLDRVSYGVAMSMAMANLPTPKDGSTYSFGIAVGTFSGLGALAIGGSALVGDTATVRASLSKAGGSVGGGVGIGWSF